MGPQQVQDAAGQGIGEQAPGYLVAWLSRSRCRRQGADGLYSASQFPDMLSQHVFHKGCLSKGVAFKGVMAKGLAYYLEASLFRLCLPELLQRGKGTKLGSLGAPDLRLVACHLQPGCCQFVWQVAQEFLQVFWRCSYDRIVHVERQCSCTVAQNLLQSLPEF